MRNSYCENVQTHTLTHAHTHTRTHTCTTFESIQSLTCKTTQLMRLMNENKKANTKDKSIDPGISQVIEMAVKNVYNLAKQRKDIIRITLCLPTSDPTRTWQNTPCHLLEIRV